jgi:nicotinate-nucleotide adenylyltransferase
VRIGVFGGSFDPVHHGHLIVADHARRALELTEVRFVPAREQPFKEGRHGASAADRLAMLRLAVAGVPGLTVDPRECRRAGPSYTVDTLRELRTEFAGAELSLLVGADAARDFPAWRESAAIRELAALVILTRPGSAPPEDHLGGRLLVVPSIDISATGVRHRVRAGESIRFLVPDAVARYITDRRLYADED